MLSQRSVSRAPSLFQRPDLLRHFGERIAERFHQRFDFLLARFKLACRLASDGVESFGRKRQESVVVLVKGIGGECSEGVRELLLGFVE
ncbi:hypothetical protein [Candidatus Binatus sp.]|uniref:hypothetical protein n=1 Tax=Candidatus Binatus sp. TaxID=2811406 RepID=UPI002FDA3343